MNYLRRQRRVVEQAIREGVALDKALATKFYIQTLLCDSVAAHVAPGARVLEVGCGGSIAIHLLARRGYRCTAIDNAPESLDFTMLLRRELGTDVDVLEADAFALPFRDGAFDYVFSVGLIEHFDEDAQRALVREMRRCTSRYVHLEAPSYAPESAFAPVLAADDEDEPHLPYDLCALLEGEGLTPVAYDGRCVFPRRELIEANPALERFIATRTPLPLPDDVERLCALERAVSRDDRLRFGYQLFAVGALPPAPLLERFLDERAESWRCVPVRRASPPFVLRTFLEWARQHDDDIELLLVWGSYARGDESARAFSFFHPPGGGELLLLGPSDLDALVVTHRPLELPVLAASYTIVGERLEPAGTISLDLFRDVLQFPSADLRELLEQRLPRHRSCLVDACFRTGLLLKTSPRAAEIFASFGGDHRADTEAAMQRRRERLAQLLTNTLSR